MRIAWIIAKGMSRYAMRSRLFAYCAGLGTLATLSCGSTLAVVVAAGMFALGCVLAAKADAADDEIEAAIADCAGELFRCDHERH